MKNYIATTIAATGLIVFVFGMECAAQTAGRLVANIPFDFYVGDEKLPKGRYEFESTSRHANAGAVVVRPTVKSERPSLIVATMTEIARPGQEPVLIFNRYGSVYFLSRVNLSPEEVSFKLRRTSAEAQTAKQQQVMPVTIRQTVATGR